MQVRFNQARIRNLTNLDSSVFFRILSAAWEKSTDDQRHKILSTTTGTAACPYYACITPLRLLLHWEKDLAPSDLLMDHNEERMKDKMSWLLSHMVVVGNLRGAMGLGERFSAQQIQRAIGIIRTNGVKVVTCALCRRWKFTYGQGD